MNKICERCKKRPATQDHAKDGNHRNRKKENREWLCVPCHAKEHGIEPKFSELRELVTYYELYQQIKNQIKNKAYGLGNIELIIPENVTVFEQVGRNLEKEEAEKISQFFKDNPSSLYQWLVSLKGISDILAAKVLSRIQGRNFRSEASLWHHAGVAPNCIKKKGEKANWDSTLKRYLLGDQQVAHEFVMQRTPKYREIYDKEKEKQKNNGLINKETGKTNLQAERRARRKVAKVFLRDLYNRLEK